MPWIIYYFHIHRAYIIQKGAYYVYYTKNETKLKRGKTGDSKRKREGAGEMERAFTASISISSF